MQKNKFKLILGSKSPRRKALLEYAFIPFEVITSDIDEVSDKKKMSEFVTEISYMKAKACFKTALNSYQNPLVLGADTIVSLDGKAIGKPQNITEARKILQSLSGKTHEVYTGVSLVSLKKESSFVVKSQVSFEQISSDLLELYLGTGESLDKAGAYGIQSHALSFINKLEGSYSNVVGLPINIVLEKLEQFIDVKDNWREYFE